MGLDPGIDHIVTMKMIDDIRLKGGKIKKLLSLCGGLLSPECVNNPLSYKFTWSPVGVFRALSNAIFLKNGQKIKIPKEDLLYNV